jgi:uncharacterized damage-inducible protein DinB
MIEGLLAEMDFEFTKTRTSLERVPQEQWDWRPHAKSFTLGRLTTHLAEIPGYATVTLTQDSWDIAPLGGGGYQPPQIATVAEAVAMFDERLAAAREAIANTPEPAYFKPWSMLRGGQAVLTLPRIATLRSFVFSHNIHHRAQLGVYLRLLDVPVPMIYGPSADEGMF